MEVGALWPKHWALTRRQYGRRRLEEEERFLWANIVEFFNMVALEYQLIRWSTNAKEGEELLGVRVIPAYADYFATILC